VPAVPKFQRKWCIASPQTAPAASAVHYPRSKNKKINDPLADPTSRRNPRPGSEATCQSNCFVPCATHTHGGEVRRPTANQSMKGEKRFLLCFLLPARQRNLRSMMHDDATPASISRRSRRPLRHAQAPCRCEDTHTRKQRAAMEADNPLTLPQSHLPWIEYKLHVGIPREYSFAQKVSGARARAIDREHKSKKRRLLQIRDPMSNS
jgi:hypothetical protein